jgi:hypothetical protein
VVEVDLINLIKRLSSFGPWLRKSGALWAILIGLLVSVLLLQLDVLPFGQTTTGTWLRGIFLISVLVSSFLCWLALTQYYLRGGKGRKIGLAYDSHAISIDDWNRTQSTLKYLFKNGKIGEHISLKFIPVESVSTDQKATLFLKRYNFSILLTVRQVKQIDTHKKKINESFKYHINIATQAQQEQFIKTILKNGLAIWGKRNLGDNLLEILEGHAKNLHDLLLLFVASQCYLLEEYEDSSVILEHLDGQLSRIFTVNEEPRTIIRYLDMNSILATTNFNIDQIPTPNELSAIEEKANRALVYFDEFPSVPVAIARIRFFNGDIDGALEITNRALAKIEELSEKVVPGIVLARIFLNKAFLAYIKMQWKTSYDYYLRCLSVKESEKLGWEQLVSFIDYVAEYQYEGIAVLQILYRRIANITPPNDLSIKATQWIEEDQTRAIFGRLLAPPSKRGRTQRRRKKR